MSGYRAPTTEQVNEVLRRIPTPQLRRAFYEGLKNPLWLEPLRSAGVFNTSPPRVTMDDGSTGDPYWPEIEYLIRVAGATPTVAVDILIGLEDSDNAWVRRALFTVGATIPASEAARLKPVLRAWLESGFGWRTDPREMVDMALNLLAGGERKTGKWLANALFRPGKREGSNKPLLMLESYWYEVGLPQIVEALGADGLRMVLGWLIEYETASGQLDGWPYSRPSVRERQGTTRDVEDALIDAVRDLAIARMTTDPQGVVAQLLSANLMLVRRIAMYATTEALARLTTGDSLDLLAAATRLLFDPPSGDERCRIEFGALARAAARKEPRALDSLADFLAQVYISHASERRERLRQDEDKSEPEIDAEVAKFTERREHIWLSSVGVPALPALLTGRLAELDERLGVIEDPLRPKFVVTSWVGPNSPLTQDAMAAMSPSELVSHLETWHDNGDRWGPKPSHEGQARTLTTLLTANPQALSQIEGLVTRLRPTYVRAILRGWASAFNANQALDFDQVVETVHDVCTHRDELDFPREGRDSDDDPDFTWAKQSAVSLLDDLVKKTDPPRIPPTVLSRLAELLIDLAPNDAAWVAYVAEDRESGMDPLTLSMNWQWPIQVHGLAALVGHGETAQWNGRAKTALIAELKRPDPRGAAHAVIGENLARLLNADESWTKSHADDWFGDTHGINVGQQIALSTALAIHHYHWKLFELLSPSMLGALATAGPLADGWHQNNSTPVQRIGEWAVKALVYGDTDWDDPVVANYFDSVDARDRGAALGHVAWEFMHATIVEESIRDRFASVWDARIAHVTSNPLDSAELREFHWVVRSDKFDSKWWVSRLQRALELDAELANEGYMIGKYVAMAADVDPRAALNIVKLLTGAKEVQPRALYDLSRNAVPMVIARALAAEDDTLKDDATIFMNKLGEAGHIDLARRVQAVQSGTITQLDILA